MFSKLWLTLIDFAESPSPTYYNSIPSMPNRSERPPWNEPELRSLRKRVNSSEITSKGADDIARDILEGDIINLACDFIGNTVRRRLNA